MKPRQPLSPSKHLGQNFLVDGRVRQRMIASCDLQDGEEVLEIGPGLGHLTSLLMPRVKKIYAIEKDPRFCEHLQKNFSPEKLAIFHGDILNFDFSRIPPGLKVVGNLPYYISTSIIETFIHQKNRYPLCFFTVQKEFGERLAAKPDSKDYGSLTCFIQYHADVKILFKIAASSFKPAPKVNSCFIKIAFRPPPFDISDEKRFFAMIRAAFNQRRKRISNSLKSFLGEKNDQVFGQCGLTGGERAENLTLKNFADLSNLG